MRKIDKISSNIAIDEFGIELYSFGEFKGAYSSKHHDSKISDFCNDLLDKIVSGEESEEVLTALIRQFLIDTTATDNWTAAIFVRGKDLFSYIGEWGYYMGYRCFEEDEDFVYFDVDDDEEEEDWNEDDDVDED